MEKKTKLYQVIGDGPDQGQIKEFDSLVSDDGVTYLKFKDGTRCNISFVGKLNDAKAYDSGMYVAEVYDRKNVWIFKKKVQGPEHRELFSEKAGQWYVGADPYYNNQQKPKTIIEALPPRRVISEEEIKTSQEKLKELGFDENTKGFDKAQGNIIIESQDEMRAMQQTAGVKGAGYNGGVKGLRPIEIIEGTTLGLDSDLIIPPTPKDLEKYTRGNEIYIPDDVSDLLEEKGIDVSNIKDDENSTETVKTPEIENVKINTPSEEKVSSMNNKSSSHTSSPIYSIVSKCKKKDIEAPLLLSLHLPGRSIYNLIKDEYDDDSIEEFFDIIIEDISVDEIKTALKAAIRDAYEGKNADQEQ